MIVADRCLHLQQGEHDVEVPVRIFAPQLDASAWSCSFEIGWPGEARRATAFGFDSVQALVLALQMIGAEIYTSDYHKSGTLNWDDPKTSDARRGYGFPVMASIRDKLIGDDAKYL